MEENKKRGGAREGAGRTMKYNERTQTVSFRVPESIIPEFKKYVNKKLETYQLPHDK